MLFFTCRFDLVYLCLHVNLIFMLSYLFILFSKILDKMEFDSYTFFWKLMMEISLSLLCPVCMLHASLKRIVNSQGIHVY